ncbi:hypothetical protein QJS66_11915 [Kocuria rhizophila]|nr:hypothetical protein QJS66_11915 [Kocuria rhizophila]
MTVTNPLPCPAPRSLGCPAASARTGSSSVPSSPTGRIPAGTGPTSPGHPGRPPGAHDPPAAQTGAHAAPPCPARASPWTAVLDTALALGIVPAGCRQRASFPAAPDAERGIELITALSRGDGRSGAAGTDQ